MQYILDTEFEGISIDTVYVDESVGLNFRIELNFNKTEIAQRYEKCFNTNEAKLIHNNTGPDGLNIIDKRPDELILSLSIAL